MNRCKECGKEILSKRTNAKYCSENCKRKHWGKYSARKRIPATYAISKIRLDILNTYNHKCAICGWKLGTSIFFSENKNEWQISNGNEIHHITPIKDGGNNEWDNLILLCPNHHKEADLGLITKEVLRGYIKRQISDNEMRIKNNATLKASKLLFGDD
jgi:5-methylcytosine-specific restriction endonuclease McrA